jgi:L-fucose mutarotase/ribose pyranase (RbsD/FucU family)
VEEQHMKEEVAKMIEQKRSNLKKEIDALSQENFVDRCKKAKIKTAGENRTESSKKLVDQEMSVYDEKVHQALSIKKLEIKKEIKSLPRDAFYERCKNAGLTPDPSKPGESTDRLIEHELLA